MYERSQGYSELMHEVIEEHEELAWIHNRVAIDCVVSYKKKKAQGMEVLGECVKVNEMYEPYCPYDFLIIIYEINCYGLTDEQMRILMYHELLHVDMSEKDGEPVYKVRPHDVQDFRTIIDQYGIDWNR